MKGYKLGLALGTAAALLCSLSLPACAALAHVLAPLAPAGSEQAVVESVKAAEATDAALWQWVLYYLGLREFGVDAVRATGKVAGRFRRTKSSAASGVKAKR